jgi:hypothetical protein
VEQTHVSDSSESRRRVFLCRLIPPLQIALELDSLNAFINEHDLWGKIRIAAATAIFTMAQIFILQFQLRVM